MDWRHDRISSKDAANTVCPATLGVANAESSATCTSACSIPSSVFQLSLYGAGQASSIEQESFHGRSPSQCSISAVDGNGSMGQSQDEAATLVPDINVMLRDVQLRKANRIQLRCELVVPSFALFLCTIRTTCSRRRSVKEGGYPPLIYGSIACGWCGWPIWLKGQSAKGLASEHLSTRLSSLLSTPDTPAHSSTILGRQHIFEL